MILRSRGATTRRGLVVFPATGRFEQQLKLSDAFSQVPGQTCPGNDQVGLINTELCGCFLGHLPQDCSAAHMRRYITSIYQ